MAMTASPLLEYVRVVFDEDAKLPPEPEDGPEFPTTEPREA